MQLVENICLCYWLYSIYVCEMVHRNKSSKNVEIL